VIAALAGTVLRSRLDGQLLLRCGPVVLELLLPAAQAGELREGDEAELYTLLHLSTAADQLRLFGFTSLAARELFGVLIGGSGIGPKVALALLDLGVPALVVAIRDGDERALTSVSGVGPKLAKKITLELSEKVGRDFAWALQDAGAAGQRSPAVREALEAVVALGYPRLRAEQALAEVRLDRPGADSSELIKLLLAHLAG
jgi:holliday junction DNA helicase RuvA